MKLRRFDNKQVIFKLECSTTKELVEAAVSKGIPLFRADLRDANLESADLRDANLESADLRDANLESADLRSAHLRDADLRSADLRYAVGNLKEVKSIQIETYHISFCGETLNIGCVSHSIEDWENFTDLEIKEMDSGALEFWNKWKDFIFTAIRLSKKG